MVDSATASRQKVSPKSPIALLKPISISVSRAALTGAGTLTCVGGGRTRRTAWCAPVATLTGPDAEGAGEPANAVEASTRVAAVAADTRPARADSLEMDPRSLITELLPSGSECHDVASPHYTADDPRETEHE